MCICLCVCVCVYVSIYIYIYVYTHTHIWVGHRCPAKRVRSFLGGQPIEQRHLPRCFNLSKHVLVPLTDARDS